MGSDARQVGDAQNEADRVEDVGFATSVEAGDGVELRVETGNNCPLRVRLEAVDDDLFDIHGFLSIKCFSVFSGTVDQF